MAELLTLINRNWAIRRHIRKLVFEYYRANGIQADWDHRHIAVFFCLDHQVAAAELFEDAIVGAITEIPCIIEGGKVLDATAWSKAEETKF